LIFRQGKGDLTRKTIPVREKPVGGPIPGDSFLARCRYFSSRSEPGNPICSFFSILLVKSAQPPESLLGAPLDSEEMGKERNGSLQVNRGSAPERRPGGLLPPGSPSRLVNALDG